MADKAMGLACGSGVNMEQNGDEAAGENTSRNEKTVCCGACGRSNHKTRRSQKCLCHSWSEKGFQEEIVRTSALRATEEAAKVAAVEEASEARSEGTCATSSASVATLTTWNLASTQSTDVFHLEESDSDDENSVSVANPPSSEAVEDPVGDAIASTKAEVSELDTVGFDETLLLDERVDA
jgi:hypothetical protein